MKVKVASLRSVTFERDLLASIQETGFVVLTDHGIPESLIRESQREWRNFFQADMDLKNGYINSIDGNMGYKGMKTEQAVGAKVPDLKEFFHWKRNERIPYALSGLTQAMFSDLNDVGETVLKAIDEVDGTDYAANCEDSDNTILRTLYYPAMDFSQEPGAVRAAAHEDINFITLLVAASAPGLEVLDKAGNWHAVPHEDNSIVMNIGDMLQLKSQGKYSSTTHRVVNPDGNTNDRISMPLFMHPHGSTILSPDFTAQQYLGQRIAEIYKASQK